MQDANDLQIRRSFASEPKRSSARLDTDDTAIDVTPLDQVRVHSPPPPVFGDNHESDEKREKTPLISERQTTYTEARRREIEDESRRDSAEEGWKLCIQEMREEDDKMVSLWNEEIDMLLIFAGLFSAVVTTFVSQSYQSLQQTLSDQTPQILLQISLQLQGMANGAQIPNLTVPAYTPQTGSASSSIVWINACWFLSLVLSISAATFCIFVRQWLRYYNDWKVPSMSASESARLRQARFMGLQRWQIALVMNVLPLLLQIALGLFLAGLLVLLWDINTIVAIVTSAVSGILVVAVIFVSLHPVFRPFSPFKSPSSWIILTMPKHFSHVFSTFVWSYKAAINHRLRRSHSPKAVLKRPLRRVSYNMDWAQLDLSHLSSPASPKHAAAVALRDKLILENVFDWMHSHRFSGTAAHEVISVCAWSGDLRVFMNLVEHYGHTNPWGYGCAIISAIHFEADCHCPDTAPACAHVHLPELVEALYRLPSWEGSKEDTNRYSGWNLAATWDCGAMLRILLDPRTKDHKITETRQFREFMNQQPGIVKKLAKSDRWRRYYRWPDRVCAYALVNPGYFSLKQGKKLRGLSLPSQSDDDDVDVHDKLTTAGRAICTYYGEAARSNSPSTRSSSSSGSSEASVPASTSPSSSSSSRSSSSYAKVEEPEAEFPALQTDLIAHQTERESHWDGIQSADEAPQSSRLSVARDVSYPGLALSDAHESSTVRQAHADLEQHKHIASRASQKSTRSRNVSVDSGEAA